MGNFFSLCLNDVVFIILQQKIKEFPVAILAVAIPCASGVTVMEVPFCRLKTAVPSSFIFTSSKLCPSATAFHVLFSLL